MLIRDWTAGGGSLQESIECKHTRVGIKRSIEDTEREDNCTGILNYRSRSSQHSTVGTMSETSLITFVYKRRKLRDGSSSVFPDQASTKEKPIQSFFAELSCEVFSASAKEHDNSMMEVQNVTDRAPAVLPTKCNGGPLLSKSTPEVWCSQAKELGSIEDPKCDDLRYVEACHVNDSCSSSQLKTGQCVTTSKPKVNDSGECSSFDALVMDGVQVTTCKKDVIASIVRALGIDKAVGPSKGLGTNCNCIGLLSCKVCNQSELTVNMLICGQCEEAFHTSCCNPPVTKIPRNQWFCHSCLKKRCEALKKTSKESRKGKSEVSKYRNATSKCASGPIALMLEEKKPYTSNVRVGPEFQAKIPDFCDAVAMETVNIGKPLKINPSVGVSSHEGNLKKNIHISICNWLQCRQVLYGADVAGAVCGKWRRAPLFERQTDYWECFDSFLWDPSHADCAVPQELETEQVLKDLKYIEMLRPQLYAEKHELGRTKRSVRKGKGPAKGVRNTGAL